MIHLPIIAVLLIVGRQQLPLGGIPIGSASCTVQADVQTGTNNESNNLGNTSSGTYGGFSFVAGSSYTLCGVKVPLQKIGSPTFTINWFIYTNQTSGCPNSLPNCPGTQVGSNFATLFVTSLARSH